MNELGEIKIEDIANFAIDDGNQKVSTDMDIDIYKTVNIDNVVGGVSTIQALVAEALEKELAGFENLKKLHVTDDNELYIGTDRYVKSKEIFVEE